MLRLRHRGHTGADRLYRQRPGRSKELQRYILTQPLPQLTLGWYSGWFYTDKRVRNFTPAKLAYESLTHTTLWLSAK
jgi:hypothetical protein